MELRDIEYFSVVARHGNLGRAAEALGLSQSALSKSLRRLEEEMRAKLVKRTPKGVELTAEGSTLLSHANRLRASLDDVVREVTDVRRGLAGHLRVGAGQGYFFHLLPAACAALSKEAPDATLSLRELSYGDASQALHNGELDLMIMESRASVEHDLVLEHLYDDRRVVIASVNHRLAGKKLVTLADVAQERWTVQGPTSAISRALHAAFESHGLPPPRVTVETGATALRCPVVASSDLLGYTWASIVRQAMPHLPLVEVNVKELTSAFSSNVLYRKGAYLSPLARRFIEILKATAQKIFGESGSR
jgi:DNA-binding transcriptional LysR family regulator